MRPFIGWRVAAISILFAMPLFSYSCTRFVKAQRFDNNCGYYINSGMDHNNPDDLDTAIKYLETNGLTTGNTTIIDRSVEDDLAIFYKDLKTKAAYLRNTHDYDMAAYKEYATMLNLKPTPILVPLGISVFPHNTLFAAWLVIGLLCLIASITGLVSFINNRSSANA